MAATNSKQVCPCAGRIHSRFGLFLELLSKVNYKARSRPKQRSFISTLEEMAPQSRPILATSPDGSTIRYHSKRAASVATGIPAASVALAASKHSLRDGYLWRFEDDPRKVD